MRGFEAQAERSHGRQQFRLLVEILVGGEEAREAEEGKGCSLDRNEARSVGQLQVYILE